MEVTNLLHIDKDRNRIPDGKDKCPYEPETHNGFKDDDGCPDSP